MPIDRLDVAGNLVSDVAGTPALDVAGALALLLVKVHVYVYICSRAEVEWKLSGS